MPYLEQEAFEPIDTRFRFYGFVNDSEFVKECQKHGIKVFGIVFEVQGWEIPAELNEEETQILAFNELRGVGEKVWMGLREFSQNRRTFATEMLLSRLESAENHFSVSW